jgi:hypothetical protein
MGSVSRAGRKLKKLATGAKPDVARQVWGAAILHNQISIALEFRPLPD